MEELIDAFSGSQVTVEQNSTAAAHPYFSLYKVKSSSASQEARRRKFLEAQKSKRFDSASHARGLATSQWDEEEEEGEMDVEYVKPPRCYKDQLMLSEWLVEVPNDFAEEWYLVLCPVGKRCLVVASKGYTKVYTKSGYRLNSFPSYLPGGHKRLKDGPLPGYTLLDCIYHESSRTFYVLDVMCWNAHPCFDSETEFRFYWLHSKMDECKELAETSRKNPFRFVPLPFYECKPDSIKMTLSSPLPFPVQLDGLLFYHRRSHYHCGPTPLVGWLKGYMVPELLHLPVPPELELERPASYAGMQSHIPEAFEKHASRRDQLESPQSF